MLNTKLETAVYIFRAELIKIVMRAEHKIGNCSSHFRAELIKIVMRNEKANTKLETAVYIFVLNCNQVSNSIMHQ